MADTYQRMTSSGKVADLPVLTRVPPKPRIPKIELEAAFAHLTGVHQKEDGSPDWAWFVSVPLLPAWCFRPDSPTDGGEYALQRSRGSSAPTTPGL